MTDDSDQQRITQDWEVILRRGFETKELDYKGQCTWTEDDKKSCCELVKDILAIANTKGGFIIIGVAETPTGFVWGGLTDSQCESFETSRLNRFVQNYTDPPINAHVIKVGSQGANFVIIEIPRFPDTPHICQKDYPGVLAAGAVYVRTANNESAPIKNSSDMRAIVEHAVRNRSDQLLSSFRAILTGTSQPTSGRSENAQPVRAPDQPALPPDSLGFISSARESALRAASIERFARQAQDAAARCNQSIPAEAAALGFRETVFHPARFEQLRFTISDLERMAETASVTYRGWPYIFYSEKRADCISHLDDSLEMLLNEPEAFQFWRLHQSGCLYVNEMFQEDERSESRDKHVLGRAIFAYTCAEAVQCLVDLFTDRLADDEVVRLYMRLSGVRGRTLATIHGNTYFETPYKCEADQIIYERQYTLAEWRAGVIPHAIDILRFVNKKFGAPDPSYEEVAPRMQKLLNRQLLSP